MHSNKAIHNTAQKKGNSTLMFVLFEIFFMSVKFRMLVMLVILVMMVLFVTIFICVTFIIFSSAFALMANAVLYILGPSLTPFLSPFLSHFLPFFLRKKVGKICQY